MATVFIYALTSTRDSGRLPWYVGQSNDPTARMKVHKRDAYKDPQVRTCAHAVWIRQEIDAGFQVTHRVLAECDSRAQANEQEILWIESLRKVNPLLVNGTRGNHKNHAARLERIANETRARLESDSQWVSDLATKETV